MCTSGAVIVPPLICDPLVGSADSSTIAELPLPKADPATRAPPTCAPPTLARCPRSAALRPSAIRRRESAPRPNSSPRPPMESSDATPRLRTRCAIRLRESDDAFEVLSDEVSGKLGVALFTGGNNRRLHGNACGVDDGWCGSPNPDGSRTPNHAEFGESWDDDCAMAGPATKQDSTTASTRVGNVVVIVSASISVLSGQFRRPEIATSSCHEKYR